MRLLLGTIRNIPGGAALENFLNHYLKRDRLTSSTRPAFLDDDVLDLGDHGDGHQELHASSMADDDEVSIFQRDPALYPTKYKDLIEESVKLDVMLFHTLFTIVKGTYLNLTTDLTGQYGRYTFAIITMWKHLNLQSCNRRIDAMANMQELRYHGDAGKWKIDFLSRARELYASGATIKHFIMHSAFNSFEGKSAFFLLAHLMENFVADLLVYYNQNFDR